VSVACCPTNSAAPTPPGDVPLSGAARRLAFPGELPASLIAGLLLLVGWLLQRPFFGESLHLAGNIAIWTSLGLGMVYGGRAAIEALRARVFDIDVLMVIAAGLAAAVGHPEDGALLLFLFVLAGALEDRAMQRTRRAVEALHKLMPTQAVVFRDGQWQEVAPESLAAGERIRIRTGELIPTDSQVLQGLSTIDQSTLTGESLPRAVQEADELYAGTLNLDNPLEAQVLRPVAESSLQKILNLVTTAQEQREPVQQVIDKLSQPYAIGVMVVSIAVLLIWWLLLGKPLLDPQGGAVYTAIALLIVGSPCALIIATPTATLAAISRAARAGLLFKGGQAIERLARLGSVAMDKTGTLTQGRPRLHQVHAIAWSSIPDMLAVAAALEVGSTHPIAVAVVEAARSRGVEPARAEDLADIPGRGISGVVEGAAARLGTYEHCEPVIPECLRARARDVMEAVRSRGQIAVVVAWQRSTLPASRNAKYADAVEVSQRSRPEMNSETRSDGMAAMRLDEGAGQAAVLILSDTIRAGAREMITSLHALGVRPVRMLTGDNRLTAGKIAHELGIDQWDAELLPQDKVRILEEMREASIRGRNGLSPRRGVGVIGDGVNDAPALAAADVSIAIGSIGSDAALESADIVLLNDDLTVIPWALRMARRARAIVVFNLFLALSIIAGMGIAVLVGSLIGRQVPLSVAVLAHEGGTLLVVFNSLRLLLVRPPDGTDDISFEEPVGLA
jgi:Zn2+/Cd2+-exporting ATPase